MTHIDEIKIQPNRETHLSLDDSRHSWLFIHLDEFSLTILFSNSDSLDFTAYATSSDAPKVTRVAQLVLCKACIINHFLFD